MLEKTREFDNEPRISKEAERKKSEVHNSVRHPLSSLTFLLYPEKSLFFSFKHYHTSSAMDHKWNTDPGK